MGCRSHVPGWHAKTEPVRKAGKLNVAGIVQEQHGDRAALFMQWKQMDWPVMIDAMDLLAVRAVPITVFIDEYGIVRAVNPKKNELEAFVATDFPKPDSEGSKVRLIDPIAEFLEGDGKKLDSIIRRLEADKKWAFHAGVAYRKRYDSAKGKPSDFRNAVRLWETALSTNPNQYIWRRRLQQYGPRLDKPYAFYDWVDQARTEIAARGEKPRPLLVEPRGSEIARPLRRLPDGPGEPKHPDPHSKLHIDTRPLIEVEATVVRSTNQKRKAVRVHLEFVPNTKVDAHWGDVGTNTFHVLPPEGWETEMRVVELAGTSTVGKRVIDYEMWALPDADARIDAIRGEAFYHVCEGESGTCVFLKKPIHEKIAD